VIRSNHYEAAFEAYLRERQVGFLAVDEAKRSILGGAAVKSLDFVVVGPDPARLVIDVKGRRFPGGTEEKPREVWQSWSTEDDVAGLRAWAERFGPDYRGILAFAYEIAPHYRVAEQTPDAFFFRGRTYLMRGIDALAYAATMAPRSRRWGPGHLPAPAFRALCRPFSYFLNPPAEACAA
jgi:hypothetical protein